MKKIFVISVVNNESDIIESFCRYTLNFCDGLLVYDDHSSDETPLILEKLIAEGLPLVAVKNADYTQNGHYQASMINALAQMALEQGADLILPMDASKFLISMTQKSVREILEKLDENIEYVLASRVFASGAANIDNTVFLPACFTWCCPPKYDTLGGVLISAKLLKSGLEIVQGNQFLYSQESSGAIVRNVCEELLLAHYPVRNVAQIQTRVIIDRLRFLNMPEHDIKPTHYLDCSKQLYDCIKNNGLENANLPVLAFAYAAALFTTMNTDGISLAPINIGKKLPGELLPCSFDEAIELKYTDYSKAQNNIYNLIFSQMELFALAYKEREIQKSKPAKKRR